MESQKHHPQDNTIRLLRFGNGKRGGKPGKRKMQSKKKNKEKIDR